MTNFILSYNGGSLPETEEQEAALTAAWRVWYTALDEIVVEDAANHLPVKAAASDNLISPCNGTIRLSGYTIISADSLFSALESAKCCPILSNGGQIAVYQTAQI